MRDDLKVEKIVEFLELLDLYKEAVRNETYYSHRDTHENYQDAKEERVQCRTKLIDWAKQNVS